jgi:hypothetical protein
MLERKRLIKRGPLPNGSGKDPVTGKFLPGWKGGPGNPNAAKATAYRLAAMQAVTPEELQKLLRVLFRKALGGDIQAARIVLERVCGRPDVGELPMECDEGYCGDDRYL